MIICLKRFDEVLLESERNISDLTDECMCAFNIVVPTHSWHETHFTMQRWKVTGCVQPRSEEACPQPSFMLGDLWHGAAIAEASSTLVNFTNLRCSFMTTMLQREVSISNIKIFCYPPFPLPTLWCSIPLLQGNILWKLKRRGLPLVLRSSH